MENKQLQVASSLRVCGACVHTTKPALLPRRHGKSLWKEERRFQGTTRHTQRDLRGLLAVSPVLLPYTETVSYEMSKMELWDDNRRLQTQVFELAPDTNGTTYNSYLIFGEKTALIDASHEKFDPLYMNTLEEELSKHGRKIDYILVSHTEPDHSGLIPKVLDLYPDAVVVGTKICIQFLEGLTNRSFQFQTAKGGDVVDLGNGHEIQFIPAPNLHWPDTMFSFDTATRILFTCDAFGLHYCTEDPFDSHLSEIEPHYRFYYDCLMKPNSRSVLTALKRVKDIPYQTIANGHGPLISYNVAELVGRYRSWSAAMGKAPASIALLYSSDYGYSDRLSQSIAKGVTKSGVGAEMVDILSVDPQELVEVLGRNKGVVLMSPPSSDSTAKTIALLLSAVKSKQRVIIAESFGGKDEPVDTLRANLMGVGADLFMDPLRVKREPDEMLYQTFEEAGTDLAQALTKKENVTKVKQGMPVEIAKALAKLSSGLYVVTAAHGNVRSAMIASWVAQASFEPLGFTVAVAKDRAIESLMQVGDEFVLNCMGEKSQNVLMKHFLQRFGPGEDRFAGVEWFEAKNGTPVLERAIAYMECKVQSRLETADHWVTYCVVQDGQVSDATARTAVHRRIVANYY